MINYYIFRFKSTPAQKKKAAAASKKSSAAATAAAAAAAAAGYVFHSLISQNVSRYRSRSLARQQGKRSEAEKSTEIKLSLTMFKRFLRGKYGQTCLRKPLKYGQTQPIFAQFLASHYFGPMAQPLFYIE